MKVKEESEKVGLKLNIQETKIMASGSITSRKIDWETLETVTDIFWEGGWKITTDSDYSNEIKRCLPLGSKVMTNLNSILKSRDITLKTKVHLVKAMVFPVVIYGCESWTIKKAEHQRVNAFELWCWKDSWESLGQQGDQPVHPKGNQSWIFIGRNWCWSWNSHTLATWCEELTHLKRHWCWERLKVGREGEDRGWDGWMASLTRWHEFE